MSASKIRVLFVAEAVTLAHLARPLSLARQLDPNVYDAVIACDPRYARLASEGPWRTADLKSISSAAFLRSLARGSPVYDEATLHSYVRADMHLMDEIRPDVVVGDFRISLSVSARLAGIPYACITNGYWSPAYEAPFVMPSLPMTRWLPIPVAQVLFTLGRPLVFPWHCRPLNAVRKSFGLSSLRNDLRRVYTDADHVLCADAYPLIDPAHMPADHSHLGPLLWSPKIEPPAWWDRLPSDRPIVYVTLGSSGPPLLLGAVLSGLRHENVSVIASKAGSRVDTECPDNARVSEYLDGDAAAALADLVVCNGGSPTTQQALAAGVPVIGLPSNMDQMLNMASLTKRGAGEFLRGDRARASAVRDLCRSVLSSTRHRSAAQGLARGIEAAPKAGDVFDLVVRRLLPGRRVASSDVSNFFTVSRR